MTSSERRDPPARELIMAVIVRVEVCGDRAGDAANSGSYCCPQPRNQTSHRSTSKSSGAGSRDRRKQLPHRKTLRHMRSELKAVLR